MPPAHAYARLRSLAFADTLDEVSIGVAPGGLMDTLLKRQAAIAGRSLACRIQVSSLDAACRIVAAGLGIAVCRREATVPHAGASRVVMVPLADPWAARRFVVCTRPDRPLPAAARLLVAHLGGPCARGAVGRAEVALPAPAVDAGPHRLGTVFAAGSRTIGAENVAS